MPPAVGGPGEPLAATSDPSLIDVVRLGSGLFDLGVAPAARTHFRDRADLVAGAVPALCGAEAGSGDSRGREAEKYATGASPAAASSRTRPTRRGRLPAVLVFRSMLTLSRSLFLTFCTSDVSSSLPLLPLVLAVSF